jgi:type IV secretory pathway TrbF-like protein
MKQASTATDGDRLPETTTLPGVARRIDHYVFIRNRLRNYQVLSVVLVALVAFALGAEIYFRATARVRLHVVEVDHLGNVRNIGPAKEIDVSDPRIVRAQLFEWVRRTRTVTSDPSLQDLYVRSATARTRGLARAAVNELFATRNPFLLAQRTLIEVTELTALPIPETSNWEVQWTERARAARTSTHTRDERWRAIVTFAWQAPEANQEEVNPLGFVLSHVAWTLLGSSTPNHGDPLP